MAAEDGPWLVARSTWSMFVDAIDVDAQGECSSVIVRCHLDDERPLGVAERVLGCRLSCRTEGVLLSGGTSYC